MNREQKIQSLYHDFKVKLHCERVWDKEIFHQLFIEMRDYCTSTKKETKLDRKTVAVFWDASWWVREQIEGNDKYSDDYFDNAVVNLDHLAWAVFNEDHREDDMYEPMNPPK